MDVAPDAIEGEQLTAWAVLAGGLACEWTSSVPMAPRIKLFCRSTC